MKPYSSPSAVDAARHVCQEARVVLTSLRGGPPSVARGDLAQDLMDLRRSLAAATVESIDPSIPFLQVVTDPRAAGPHTLIALRAIVRLLEWGTFQHFKVQLPTILQSVLACKFEQTDAGADEAVEMAIGDVVSLIILTDHSHNLPPPLLMEAFHTVFVTRATFVQSPALSYHFEDILTTIVTTVFQSATEPARMILDFLVHQLLHTPLVGGDGMNEAVREARQSHDAARVLCLRLVRRAIAIWTSHAAVVNNDPILHIVQDDLCLSLLMTGQAIWAYHDANNDISPGFVSLDVLTEICATIAVLWNTLALRAHLIAQFETILTGFYTRALVLLRKRKQATNSVSFNANFVFDAEVEIILESLVDLLCLHDHQKSLVNGDGGALETIFVYYDCQLRRSDVATGLMTELCRACGGALNQDGEVVLLTPNNSLMLDSSSRSSEANDSIPTESAVLVQVEHPWRTIPAHLKELCAQAIMGGMKCLFRDDKASEETLHLRSQRRRSIMLRQVDGMDPDVQVSSQHHLRDIKSKKRLMRKAAMIFNTKASRGIEFLMDAGLVPDPVTPESVAIFLRNGIVVGLDKKEVGAYLGEAGKAPVAGKSPPDWERDWFHKDVLRIYCSLFRFEQQSVLDALRMFLAAFRLPGEAQQIDRILQAYADRCGTVCDESVNGRLKLFSEDPKRASDAAYLLSFSIIMLNTDRHNANIREDRKMSLDDFVKNNTDYGRDITERGMELPREYLVGIYHSINEEEIRTEGEGADGVMTVERWKDVLRGSTADSAHKTLDPSVHDAEDVTELVLEHVWRPIMSAIGAFWGVRDDDDILSQTASAESGRSGMFGAQGARLGMDMALEMLQGVRQLGRIDIFRKIFTCVCDFTGLMGEYTSDTVDRTWALTNSVESQSAVVVALTMAIEAGEDLDEDGWKRAWAIVLELRDLKLIPLRSAGLSQSLLRESGKDLLTDAARREWTICLIKGDMNFDTSQTSKGKDKKVGLLGAFGRALFGADLGPDSRAKTRPMADESPGRKEKSIHGKDDLFVWDDGAPSDEETEPESPGKSDDDVVSFSMSPGAKFEGNLVRESVEMAKKMDLPVTGLESVEETRRYQTSPRALVRERFRRTIPFRRLVSDTRFMEDDEVVMVLKALCGMIPGGGPIMRGPQYIPRRGVDRSISESSSSSGSNHVAPVVPVSPASEAMAEVLICEIALKNKDRLKMLWDKVLQDHYVSRLTGILVCPAAENSDPSAKLQPNPGLEKRVTGVLHITLCSMKREQLANDVLASWKYMLPTNAEQHASSPLRVLDRHFGEGVWRIASDVDSLKTLTTSGWEGFMSLLNWCANRGGYLKPVRHREIEGRSAFSEDDPALQAYRSLHLILNTADVVDHVPPSVTETLRMMVRVGERRRYAQLSMATLDLSQLLLEKKLASFGRGGSLDGVPSDQFWTFYWRKAIEGIAEAAEQSSDTVSTASEIPIVSRGHTLTCSGYRMFDSMLFLCLRICSWIRVGALFQRVRCAAY